MTHQIIIVLVILFIALVLFITEKIRVDIISMMIVVILIISGILSADEGLSGFGNEGTITIAAMFILSEGLFRTGVVVYLGRIVTRVFKMNFIIACIITFSLVALVSAFINNTPVVAIFLPILLQVAKDSKISASKLLMPLSYASILGGIITLIGTSTNIIVNSFAVKLGQHAFSMFEMAPAALVIFAIGIIYVIFIGIPLIPSRRAESDLTTSYGLGEYLTEIIVKKESNSVNVELKDSPLVKNLGIDVLEIVRGEERIFLPSPQTVLKENDLLRVKLNVENVKELQEKDGVLFKPGLKWKDQDFTSPNISLVEAVIAPHSFLEDKTLKQSGFKERFGLTVLGIRHRGRFMQEHVANTKLQPGDALLMEIDKTNIESLRENNAFLFVNEVEPPTFIKSKILIAILVIVGVVIASSLELLPIAIAALIGSLVLVLTRCISIDHAYRAIDWQIIFLLAGTLSLGQAMEKTGAAKLISDTLVSYVGSLGPYIILGAFYLLTLVLTEVMSNTATAALVTPIAISTAVSMGLDPRPFLIVVMFAASLAFMSPVGYQTHLLVYNPGRYKFKDFLKVGTPLDIICWVTSVVVVPIFFPFK
ncbi:MAG TPA: SLC13 family permease [Ignavibacteriaceae bacterium]|nr:SLC13 family permease [Ignavibacteriaceae bacterium]